MECCSITFKKQQNFKSSFPGQNGNNYSPAMLCVEGEGEEGGGDQKHRGSG